MKKFISLLLAILCVFSTPLSVFAINYTATFDVNSEKYLLMEMNTKAVILEKDTSESFDASSFTKIVTALTVFENCESLDSVVTAPYAAFDDIYGTNSATAGIVPNEELTVLQLLYCMMLQSANEAANILAYHVGGGSIGSFVNLMNDYVESLGCKNTQFKTPHGLFEGEQTTTVEDLAIICTEAISNDVFMEIADSSRYTIPETNLVSRRVLVNTNYLIDSTRSEYYYEYAHGIKTSASNDGIKRSLVSMAEKDGYSYLCIMIDAPYSDSDGDGDRENNAMLETKKAYRWAFSSFENKVIVSSSRTVCEIPVRAALNIDHTTLVPETDVYALVPSNLDSSGVIVEPVLESLPEYLTAPVNKGDKIGQARIIVAGSEIATVDLIASEDIERSNVTYIMMVLHNIVSSIWFKIIIIIIAAFIALYIAMVIAANKKKKAKRKSNNLRVMKSAENDQNPKFVRTFQPKNKKPRRKAKKYK